MINSFPSRPTRLARHDLGDLGPQAAELVLQRGGAVQSGHTRLPQTLHPFALAPEVGHGRVPVEHQQGRRPPLLPEGARVTPEQCERERQQTLLLNKIMLGTTIKTALLYNVLPKLMKIKQLRQGSNHTSLWRRSPPHQRRSRRCQPAWAPWGHLGAAVRKYLVAPGQNTQTQFKLDCISKLKYDFVFVIIPVLRNRTFVFMTKSYFQFEYTSNTPDIKGSFRVGEAIRKEVLKTGGIKNNNNNKT